MGNMTLREIDSDLYIDLLTLSLRGGWEAYPTTVTTALGWVFSPLVMWLKIGG